MSKAALTPKQERFVEEYLIDLNATRAYRDVYGVGERVASAAGARLLANVRVALAVAAGKEERAERVEVTQDYVLINAIEVVERCLQRAPVMVRRGKEMVQAQDEDGNDLWRFDATGVNNALALLAKHTGGFSDRIDHTTGGQPINGIAWRVVKPEPGTELNRLDAILAAGKNGNGKNGHG